MKTFIGGFFYKASSVSLAGLIMICFYCSSVHADPVGKSFVRKAVVGWLRTHPDPLEAPLSDSIGSVDSYAGGDGSIIYYVVNLNPTGFVVLSGDDLAGPVIAFSSEGKFDPNPDNPLTVILKKDLPKRIGWARKNAGKDRQKKIKGKWQSFEGYGSAYAANEPEAFALGAAEVSDVRVEPFVQSQWGQTTIGNYIGGINVYNYYTPNNWPCGCIATVMSQLMRYHEYPNGAPWYFDWDLMPLVPDDSITTNEQMEIGNICFQAAESVNMTYGASVSSSYPEDASRELRDSFSYSNSIHGWYNNNSLTNAQLIKILNPNMDAHLPVILGISGPQGGHAVICDGYGFVGSTQYHHLNMGWSGTDDAWYALPIIDASEYYSNVAEGCIYNVYPTGTGEIISGRVVDLSGAPIGNVTVTAGNGTYSAQTDSHGVYALAKVPSDTSFTIAASKGDWVFASQSTATTRSVDRTLTCGNIWGVDFAGTISAGFIEFDKTFYTAGETIGVRVVDSDLVGALSQNIVITTLAGETETVVLNESPAGSGVFEGSILTAQNSFTPNDGTLQIWHGVEISAVYSDNDDGTGNSATSTDTATAKGIAETIFFYDFEGELGLEWWIVDGNDDYYTWELYGPIEGFTETTALVADSDYAGNIDMDEEAILSLDCSGLVDVKLKFDHDFKHYFYGVDEIADVDISIDEGPWINIATYQGQDHSGSVELDISSYADDQSMVDIRWHYYNANWDYHWAIDNVEITAVLPAEAPYASPQVLYTGPAITKAVTLTSIDEGYPRGIIDYIITSLPRHGILIDPAGGQISASELPYTLKDRGDTALYESYACFAGVDGFDFAADDGGIAPDGGISGPAMVSIGVSPASVFDFDSGLPVDWDIIDGYTDGNQWYWSNEGSDAFMVADSDLAGAVDMDEELITASMDFSSDTFVGLIFDHYFSYYEGSSYEIADVDISVDDGPWTTLISYHGQDYWGLEQLDISPLAAGQSNVRIRFHYYDANFEWWWAIYQVAILTSSQTISGDFEGNCAVDIFDFARLSAAWNATDTDENYNYDCDIAQPYGIVDLADLLLFSQNWLGQP